jgi:hypothetical protein
MALTAARSQLLVQEYAQSQQSKASPKSKTSWWRR